MSAATTGRAVREVVVHPDADLVARAAAARLLTTLLDAQSHTAPVHVVLTGGGVGTKMLAAIGSDPLRAAVDWSQVHLWWGDERFVPDGHEDRNEAGARTGLIGPLGDALPAANVHAMGASDVFATPEEAAAAYQAELAAFAPEGQAVPAFDVLLLGMGPDGHVASLFPGHPGLDVTGVSATAVHDSPKPPPLRVSLTFEAIRAAKQVWVVAAGAEKAPAVAHALADGPVHEVPAAGALGTDRTLWLVDVAATADVVAG